LVERLRSITPLPDSVFTRRGIEALNDGPRPNTTLQGRKLKSKVKL
jgi:hypothetical protein